MSRRLCIGILGLTPGWKTILDQIGCWYEEVHEVPNSPLSHSLLIINKTLSNDEQQSVEVFVSNRGAILKTEKASNIENHSTSLQRIYNDSSLPFLSHIPFLDIYHERKDATFADLISFEADCVYKLGISPDHLIQDNTYTRKRFFFKTGAHPDELANNITKHELTEFIHAILKEIHFRLSLPFANKWNSPEENPVFAFRIDSDYGDQDSINELYRIGKEYNIPITWFLHVEAHEEWLSFFEKFKEQEIALHGYEHGTSSSYEHVINNVETGLQKLRDEGLDPKGFCAPYAIWNATLEEVLKQFNFEYSSEFTIGYDGLPFYPDPLSENLPLQIPIHPICTGSLSRKRISESEMGQYFIRIMEHKLARHYPVLFYHHPLQPGSSIWSDIFKKVGELGLTKLSFIEYSEFWKKRLSAKFEVYFDEESGKTVFQSSSTDLIYQQSNNHKTFELIRVSDSGEVIETMNKSYNELSHPSLNELKELTSSKFQLLKTSILDWRNRKKL